MILPWYSILRRHKRQDDNNEPKVGERYDGPRHRPTFHENFARSFD